MTDPTVPTPQDADTTQAVTTGSTQQLPTHGAPATAWTTWVPTTSAPPPAPASATPAPATPVEHPGPVATPPEAAAAPVPPPQPERPRVTYLPPPSGPNWGLVVVGIVFALVGAGVVANQVAGFQVASLTELGPSVLVVGGLALALLGMVGILTRRRRG